MRSQERKNRAAYEKAGRRAETVSCWYLRLKGYRILERRFKTPRGEIDIIARKKGTLAIIEVKQRATLDAAEESLTASLMRRVTDAADIYYARFPRVQNLGVRFDAVFIVGAVTWRWKITHVKDAWRS